ncbi:MAG: BamA/TamA family outer membrane protein [Cyanobacteria bacterium P01_C01_bin.89]
MKMLRQFWFSPALVVLSVIAAVDLPAQAQLNEQAVAEEPPLNNSATAAAATSLPAANLSAAAIANPAAASVYAVSTVETATPHQDGVASETDNTAIEIANALDTGTTAEVNVNIQNVDTQNVDTQNVDTQNAESRNSGTSEAAIAPTQPLLLASRNPLTSPQNVGTTLLQVADQWQAQADSEATPDSGPSDGDAPPAEEAAPAAPTSPAPRTNTSTETQVLVAEVAVTGVGIELQRSVYDAIRTRPGENTSRSLLREDVNRIFATGLFADVNVRPEDTPLGVRVTFEVVANPELRAVEVSGAEVIPDEEVDRIFSPLYGRTLNLNELQSGIEDLNQWYQQQGFVLAQVVGAPQISSDGTVRLEVTEGQIEDIELVFLDEDGETTDEDGNPVEGRTRDFIVFREMQLKPGATFNRNLIQQDLQRIFGLGMFEDVQVKLNPGDDPRKVDVLLNLQEKNTAVIGAEAGFSSSSGIFGAVSFQEQNLGGNNQRLGAEVQLSDRGFGFDLSFTDPWIAGDPNRTSYTVNLFKRRTISLIFDGGDREVELDNGDRPRIDRLGGRVVFSRPLANNWRGSAGIEFQHIEIVDRDGDVNAEDELGNDLSFSGDGIDDLLTLELNLSQDLRNDPIAPTDGSALRFGVDQSIPVGRGSIFFNRLRGSYSRYFPVNWTNFAEGAETLAFNVQGGIVLGDLPPYEAFAIGGTNSVRGYGEGEVGSGRYYVQGTAEYRFPVITINESIPIGGVLFVDVGSDLGSASAVPGNPAGARRKPGTGIGFGIGVRARTPFGPIRLDYGVNDEGDSRLHFGIGERF